MIDLDDDDDDDLQCPLCCEDMDLSDRNFLPCQCGYRVSPPSARVSPLGVLDSSPEPSFVLAQSPFCHRS